MNSKLAIFALAISLLAGCAATELQPDLEEARTSLLEADRAWSQTVGDAAAFAGYFAPQGKLMPPEDDLLTGRTEIQSAAEQMFSTPGFSLAWEADSAEVSDDASLGYTTGTFRLALPAQAEEGAAVERTGNYVTVWRRQEDGSWKVVVDTPTFNTPPPAPPAEEE